MSLTRLFRHKMRPCPAARTLLSAPTPSPCLHLARSRCPTLAARVPPKRAVGARAAFDESKIIIGSVGSALNLVVLLSEFDLFTTGHGLPPGPYGIYGATEGIGYLVVVGIVGWSVVTKVQTGSGLPAGKAGLLGAAEGLSYLSVLGGVIAAGKTFLEQGGLPGITG
jgi:hypothetical protein